MKLLKIIILVASISLFGYAAYYFLSGLDDRSVSFLDEREKIPKAEPLKSSRQAPDGMKEYRSDFYRFQFFYPDHLEVEEYPVPVSAVTLVFSSAKTGENFQLFIVPHGSPDITDHRIKQDLSSGIMNEIEEIELSGAKGISFVSHDPAIGDTREVWFVARGFMYELTAPLALDAWLAEMMASWEFL